MKNIIILILLSLNTLDLFGNPIGSLTVLHFFGLKSCKNAFLKGSC